MAIRADWKSILGTVGLGARDCASRWAACHARTPLLLVRVHFLPLPVHASLQMRFFPAPSRPLWPEPPPLFYLSEIISSFSLDLTFHYSATMSPVFHFFLFNSTFHRVQSILVSQVWKKYARFKITSFHSRMVSLFPPFLLSQFYLLITVSFN